jgi:hypothetical protein
MLAFMKTLTRGTTYLWRFYRKPHQNFPTLPTPFNRSGGNSKRIVKVNSAFEKAGNQSSTYY